MRKDEEDLYSKARPITQGGVEPSLFEVSSDQDTERPESPSEPDRTD